MKKYDNNKTYVLSGQSMNQIADGINYVNEFRQADSAASMRPYQPGEIRVFNDPSVEDAKTIPAYTCIILSSLCQKNDTIYQYIAPSVSKDVVFYGHVPRKDEEDKIENIYAVTSEPIEPGSVGIAVLSGLAFVRDVKESPDYKTFLRPCFDGTGSMEFFNTGKIRALGKYLVDTNVSPSGRMYLVQLGGTGTGDSANAELVTVTSVTGAGVIANEQNGFVYSVYFPDMLIGTTATVELDQTLVVYPRTQEGVLLKTTIPEE